MILSLLQSVMNCRVGRCKISHLSLNLLPHYLVKFKCSNIHLYGSYSQFKVCAQSIINSKYLREIVSFYVHVCRPM